MNRQQRRAKAAKLRSTTAGRSSDPHRSVKARRKTSPPPRRPVTVRVRGWRQRSRTRAIICRSRINQPATGDHP